MLTFSFIFVGCTERSAFGVGKSPSSFLWFQVAEGEGEEYSGQVLQKYTASKALPRSISCASGAPTWAGAAHGRARPRPPHPRLHVSHLPLWLSLLPLISACGTSSRSCGEQLTFRPGSRLPPPRLPRHPRNQLYTSHCISAPQSSLPEQASKPECPTQWWSKLPRWPQLPRRSPM